MTRGKPPFSTCYGSPEQCVMVRCAPASTPAKNPMMPPCAKVWRATANRGCPVDIVCSLTASIGPVATLLRAPTHVAKNPVNSPPTSRHNPRHACHGPDGCACVSLQANTVCTHHACMHACTRSFGVSLSECMNAPRTSIIIRMTCKICGSVFSVIAWLL
jgi:hypothetical protein